MISRRVLRAHGGGSLRRRGRLVTCRSVGGCWVGVVLLVVSLCGCSGSQPEQGAQQVVPGDLVQDSEEAAGAAGDPRELSITELNEGPGVLELGASKLLAEVGVLELLDGYIINVPPTAAFISNFERAKSMQASHYINADAGAEGEILHAFENEVLYHAGAATSSIPESGGSRVLHDMFFGALEECGRASRWPEVELFVLHEGRGYDVLPDIVEPTLGLSYYEYQQLKHQCARYAATYPGLDETVRDEFLGPQRQHYAHAVVEGLAANPHIEVPERYRGEFDELLREGW